jgi:ferredoxin--NADP+ reductase
MFGRRGPIEAGFTPKELGEVRNLERCAAIVSAGQIPTEVKGDFGGREKGIKEKNINILRELATQSNHKKPVKMHFQFYSSPLEILGTDRVEAIRLERTEVINGKAITTGDTFDIPCCSVITAIGYHANPPKGLSLDGLIIGNTNGWVRENIYVVGWAKRGSSGTIPTNGPDSREVVDILMENLKKSGIPKVTPGGPVIDRLLSNRGVRVVLLEDMEKIKIAEIENAVEGRPWEKFTSVNDMIDVLDR